MIQALIRKLWGLKEMMDIIQSSMVISIGNEIIKNMFINLGFSEEDLEHTLEIFDQIYAEEVEKKRKIRNLWGR